MDNHPFHGWSTDSVSAGTSPAEAAWMKSVDCGAADPHALYHTGAQMTNVAGRGEPLADKVRQGDRGDGARSYP